MLLHMDAKVLNRILEQRVKAQSDRPIPRSKDDHQHRVTEDREVLLKCLGLSPLPPRTELNARITGVIQRDGYHLEKLRYESRPGLLVTAHLYMPEGKGPFPVVVSPHGHWSHKKSTPVVQARGISMALQGFATLIVDSPGYSWDDNPQNERKAQGVHFDQMLQMGLPIQGIYTWDIMRGIDYLETRADCDCKRIGITGTSGGGTGTMYAFAVDERISVAAPVCSVASMEIVPHNGCLCNHVPGALAIGDRSDVLALRAPAPIMVVSATDDGEFPPESNQRTTEKLKAIYKHYKADSKIRLEIIESQHDYSRRMREVVIAFFREHLLGEPARTYVTETRPLTDGGVFTFPAGTEPEESEELLVTLVGDRPTVTFSEILKNALDHPYPEPFDANARLVPWARFGKFAEPIRGTNITLLDKEDPDRKDAIVLPIADLDYRLCIYLGLSIPEFFAQVVHHLAPGGPEGWEASGMAGDAITSVIASMKTLMGSAASDEPPLSLHAEGPVSSMTARFLKLLRPNLEIYISESQASWKEINDHGLVELAQPKARYLAWPF